MKIKVFDAIKKSIHRKMYKYRTNEERVLLKRKILVFFLIFITVTMSFATIWISQNIKFEFSEYSYSEEHKSKSEKDKEDRIDPEATIYTWSVMMEIGALGDIFSVEGIERFKR